MGELPKVGLNENDVKDYLDKCIRSWRDKRDNKNCSIAHYYIDVFQSVRVSLFGELLSDSE